MQTLSFDVSGMTCGGCTGSVQRALSRIPGVSHAEVTPAQIESAITQLGYPAKVRPAEHDEHART